jgi:hypothetical protein
VKELLSSHLRYVEAHHRKSQAGRTRKISGYYEDDMDLTNFSRVIPKLCKPVLLVICLSACLSSTVSSRMPSRRLRRVKLLPKMALFQASQPILLLSSKWSSKALM